jgi:hypothetical protein
MSVDFSFSAKRRGDRFVFIAKEFGVVVWSDDPAAGIKDLETRVEEVAAQFRDAGVESQASESTSGTWPNLWPFFIKTAVIIMAIAIITAWVAIPFATALSGLSAPIANVMLHPAQFVVRMGDRVDQLPAERVEQLKLAVRKVVKKIGPILDEGRQLSRSN